jgi:hypothetical protein
MKIALKIGILLLFAVVSCKSNKSNLTKSESDSISDTTIVINTDTVTYQKVQEDEKEIVVNIDSVLKANINIKIDYQDSLVYVLGIKEFYDTANGQIVAFTKLKDNSELFAIVFPNTFEDENQTNVLFYMLKHDGWILVSKFDYDRVFYFEIVDINNDGVREIQSIGFPNMNGNYWNNFYSFSKEENKFIDGGGFFSSMYEFKPQVNRIEVEYGGSWYMPNTKTIYYWKNQKLIPFKKVEVGLKIADMKHNAQYIKYSENLTLEKDSVQLVYKKSFRGKKLNQFYDNFFENN